MYTVTDKYNSIIASHNHWFRTKIAINGVDYEENAILSASSKYRAFSSEQPTVGGCLAGELEVEMLAPHGAIPRMAQVRPYVQAVNDTQESEWIPQGVYYIDTRETTHNDDGMDILTLHCYDAMLKAEADFPDTRISFPTKDYTVVQIIAQGMGLQSVVNSDNGIDARTKTLMGEGSGVYDIKTLPIAYSMREVLSRIAAMYAGNWIMNYDGQLRLVALVELPSETNYLIDNAYEPITFGGVRILV